MEHTCQPPKPIQVDWISHQQTIESAHASKTIMVGGFPVQIDVSTRGERFDVEVSCGIYKRGAAGTAPSREDAMARAVRLAELLVEVISVEQVLTPLAG